jgi:hypothetical protein
VVAFVDGLHCLIGKVLRIFSSVLDVVDNADQALGEFFVGGVQFWLFKVGVEFFWIVF